MWKLSSAESIRPKTWGWHGRQVTAERSDFPALGSSELALGQEDKMAAYGAKTTVRSVRTLQIKGDSVHNLEGFVKEH